MAQRTCPICDSKNVDILHTQRFELPKGHPLADGYNVVVCLLCGFVYADTEVPQEAYDRFYAEFSKYEDATTSTGGGEQAWDRKRLEDTACEIADFLQNPEARIVDIGCANGGLLKALKEIGYSNLCGIDPSPVCVKNTRALNIEAHSGSLFQISQAGEFDCIILSHTLEHVQELRLALNCIKDVLRKDPPGVLYVEVPDAARYKDFVFAPFQDFNTEHINHFSRQGLKNLLHSIGFTVLREDEKTIESSPDMPYPATYMFCRYTPDEAVAISPDVSLRASIEKYIAQSRQTLNEMDDLIAGALAKNPRVIIWGAGQLTMKLLAETSLGQATIAALIDSNPINQGKVLRGIEVIAPEKITDSEVPILISSTLHQKNIIEQIHKMGIANPLILLGVE